MSKINPGRVLLGGLVAGLVLNIGEYLLNEVVLGNLIRDFLKTHNFELEKPFYIPIAVAVTFCLGVLLIWLYAMIRPRTGPGPKTALLAALIMWLAIYIYTGTITGLLLGIPLNTMMLAAVWGLAEYGLGALAGAALYRE